MATNRTAMAIGVMMGAVLATAGIALTGRVWAQEKPVIKPLNLSAPLAPERQAEILAKMQRDSEAARAPMQMQMRDGYIAVLHGNRVSVYRIDPSTGNRLQTFTLTETDAR